MGGGNRVAKFWTSTTDTDDPDAATWSQLGTTVTTAGTTTIHSGTAALNVGGISDGTANLLIGSVRRAQVWSGVRDFSGTPSGGTLAFDSNFVTKTVCDNTFTESSSNAATVTINGLIAQSGDGRVGVSSVTGATWTLSKPSGTVSTDYMRIAFSAATGGATFYAGDNSVDVSGNSGWIFTAPPSGSTSDFFQMFDI